jgi:hypothetical protein
MIFFTDPTDREKIIITPKKLNETPGEPGRF